LSWLIPLSLVSGLGDGGLPFFFLLTCDSDFNIPEILLVTSKGSEPSDIFFRRVASLLSFCMDFSLGKI